MPFPFRRLTRHLSTPSRSPSHIFTPSLRQTQMVLKHAHTMPSPPKKQINLLRGWPSPSLLPAPSLLSSAQTALTDPATFIPGLQYGPDPGYLPLREELSRWLSLYYRVSPDVDRICVTGGASQNLACLLQGFTDPGYTRAVWMVAPCYFLAGPIFEDAGFYGGLGRLRGFGEDGEGPDVEGEFWSVLEKGLWEMEMGELDWGANLFVRVELEREIFKFEKQEWPDKPVSSTIHLLAPGQWGCHS